MSLFQFQFLNLLSTFFEKNKIFLNADCTQKYFQRLNFHKINKALLSNNYVLEGVLNHSATYFASNIQTFQTISILQICTLSQIKRSLICNLLRQKW